jgi:hypothetical protein
MLYKIAFTFLIVDRKIEIDLAILIRAANKWIIK